MITCDIVLKSFSLNSLISSFDHLWSGLFGMFVKIIAIQYLSQLAPPVRPDFKIIILGEVLGQKDENTVNINSSKNSNFKEFSLTSYTECCSTK